MDMTTARRTQPEARLAAAFLVVATALWFSGLRGSDYPAQMYRVGLVRRFGIIIWNANWYGGHYLPGYGIVFPFIAGLTGIGLPAVASAALSVLLLGSIFRRTALPHVTAGTSVFALLMLISLYVGRIPFGVGLMFALACLRAALSRRWILAGAAAVMASLSSPLVSAFLAVAWFSWVASSLRQNRRGPHHGPIAFLTLASVAAPLAINLAFPERGPFPFRGADMVLVIAVAVVVWRAMPARTDCIRFGFAATAVAAVPLYAIPNPIGGNLGRLALIGAPTLAAASFPRRRVQLLLVTALLVWQAKPLLMLPRQITDPSAHREYHDPLVEKVLELANGPARVEIPFTDNHWEAAFVADRLPLARGWERQLDYRYNHVLYEDDLDVSGYRRWLDENAVSFVAVPDVPLEGAAERESALVASAPYLALVWENQHWRLYTVSNPTPLLIGPGVLRSASARSIVIGAEKAAPMLLRYRYNENLVVADGRGCVAASPDGWSVVTAFGPGTVEVTSRLDADQPEPCNRA